MKKLFIFFSILPIFSFAQPFIMQTQVNESFTNKAIANQTFESTWAAPVTSNELGQCVLSFILNQKENYIPIDYKITEYYPAKLEQLYVPTNWNLNIPYPIKLIEKQKYETEFKQLFSTTQKMLFNPFAHNKNTNKLNIESFLLANYLLCTEIISIRYNNSLRITKEATDYLLKGELNSALLALDSSKINFYKQEIEFSKNGLNEYAPNYEYSIYTIENKERNIKEAERLKSIINLLNNNLAETSENNTSHYLQAINYLLNNDIQKSEKELESIKLTITNPYKVIQIETFLAFIKHLQKKEEEARAQFEQIVTNYFSNEEKFQQFPFAQIVKTYSLLSNYLAKNEDISKNEMILQIQNFNPNHFIEIDWLKIVLKSYFPFENYSQNSLNYQKDLLVYANVKNQATLAKKNFNNVDFDGNNFLLNSLFDTLINTNIPSEKTSNLLLENTIFQYINYSLSENENKWPDLLKNRISMAEKNNNQELAHTLKALDFKTNTTNINTSENELTAILKMEENKRNNSFNSQNINEIYPIISLISNPLIKNFLSLELGAKAAEFSKTNDTESYLSNNLLFFSHIEATNHWQFFTDFSYFKKYLYQFWLSKANFLLKQSRYEEALTCNTEISEYIESHSKAYPNCSEKYKWLIHFQRLQIYISLNQYESAFEQMNNLQESTKYAENESDLSQYNFLSAKIYQHFEQYDQALLYYNKVVQNQNISSNLIAEITLNEVEIYKKQKNLSLANQRIEKSYLEKLEPKDKIQLMFEQVQIFLLQEKLDEALNKIIQIEAQQSGKNLNTKQKIELANIKATILNAKNKGTEALNKIDKTILKYNDLTETEELAALAHTFFIQGEIYQKQENTQKAIQAFENCIKTQKLVYENQPGDYELEIGYSYLKIAEIANKSIQKNLTQDMHKIGLENAGLAVNILKHFNQNSVKAQLALKEAIELRNKFEEIIW